MYFSKSTNGFYDKNINNIIPKDAVELDDETYTILFKGIASGKTVVADENGIPVLVEQTLTSDAIIRAERIWRDKELELADIELYKVQDADPSAYGTVAQWREYRKNLRRWPESENFPDKSSRPLPPTK